MAENNGIPAVWNLGDRVGIRRSGGMKGRIVELRGPLGPGGAQVFRIKVRWDPEPFLVEVLEEQLVRLRDRKKSQESPT